MFICSVVLVVSSLLPISLPYKKTAFMHALVILRCVFTARCGSLQKILESANEADLALLSLFSKCTLYLSFFFASPR